MISGMRSWLTKQFASINRSTVVPRARASSSRSTLPGTTYCCHPLGGGQLVGTISVCVIMGAGVKVGVVAKPKPDNIVGLGKASEVGAGGAVPVGRTIVGNKATGWPCAKDSVIPPITIMIDAMAVSIPIKSSRMAFMGMVSAGRFPLR